MQGPQELPKAPLGNNVRPLQALHYRPIRTNIDFPGANDKNLNCPSMFKDMGYRAGDFLSPRLSPFHPSHH